MSALIVCWIAFPVLLALIAQGCGTLVERAAALRLPTEVRIPCGVALMIVVLDVIARSSSLAHLAVPAVVVLAGIGLALSRPWRWRPRASLAVAAIVLAVYAAPVVMSGMATWAGYMKLDDTATWLALVDRALGHGQSLAGLPPSDYRRILQDYLVVGYPLGAFLPFGIGHVVLGEDNASLVDPWMAFLTATLGLALYRIARTAIGERARAWRSALAAILAGQSALLYGYYLWGGIKEVAGATLIATFAVTAPLAVRGGGRVRRMVPAAVVVCALVAALSPGGFVYLVPGALLALALAWLQRALRDRMRPAQQSSPKVRRLDGSCERVAARTRLRLGAMWAAPTLLALLGIGFAIRPGGFVRRFLVSLTGETELGVLIRPLHVEQVAGIWPADDFRFPAELFGLTGVLIALAIVCALAGFLLALRDGRTELVLYVLCALCGALIVRVIGSPWLAGKSMASASPAVPVAALSAVLRPIGSRPAMRGRHLRVAAAAVGGCAIAGGIAWSNALAYHGASLAPRPQLQELSFIERRIAHEGPTLMTEYEPYASRHFLREAAVESATEFGLRKIKPRAGHRLELGAGTDLDDIRLRSVLAYRTILMQRSPTASRPPSPYRLILADNYWEVWQRPVQSTTTSLWHMSLGDATRPGGVPDCRRLKRLARQPAVRLLVAEPVENPIVVAAARSAHPADWSMNGPWLSLAGSGNARLAVDVQRAGRYSVWLGGSTRGSLSVYLDGRRTGRLVDHLEEAGQYLPFGHIFLRPGRHTVELRYAVDTWRPGTGFAAEPVGPLVLRREASDVGPALSRAPLIRIPAAQAATLCGRTLDWVEGIR